MKIMATEEKSDLVNNADMKVNSDEQEADTSSDEEENEKLVDAKIQKLILQVETTPFQYEKHIELIAALRASGDLDQLRAARENMASIYPLSEELWLEWFQDELPLAVIPEQKQYIISKFEAAVNDYASIKVWHEYCQYMMNNIDSPSDIERARNVFEQAITAVGLHLTEGSSIWDGYREFEIAILDSYQQLQDSGDTVGMESKVQTQIERIASIFKRELSIPLLGSPTTYKSFEDWYSEPIPDETKRLFERAQQKLTLLMEYEEKLHSAEGNKLPEYTSYINYEIEGGDPARIQCIFERAIKDNCLDYDLWEKYTNYMDFKLKIPSLAVRVHERAVRNVPWISKLWQNYFKALERNSVDAETYINAFDQSLKGGFAGAESYLQIWLTRCDYFRRRIADWTFEEGKIEELHKSFESGVTYMNHYFGLEGDKYCLLLREWAFIEAKYLQNVKRSQELWDTVMKKHSRDHAMWLEYIHFLMLFTDVVTVRRVFQRAIQISMEQPEIICDAFMKFERHYGMLQDIDDAQQKIDVQIRRTKERREKESIKDNSVIVCDNRKKLKQKFGKNSEELGKKKKKKKFEKEKNPLKRSKDSKTDLEPEKKKQFSDPDSQNLICMEESNFPLLTCLNVPSEIPELKINSITTTSQSNLTYDEAPASTANNVPQPTAGEVSNSTETPTNHVPLVGDMFVDRTDHDKSKDTCKDVPTRSQVETSNVRFEENIESSKVDNDFSVFLSNLLFSVEESHLREMFTPCGEIERIQLIKNKAGKSKGYAYLQFKLQESVSKALELDRQALLDRPIFVSKCVDKKENPTQFKFPTSLDKRTLYVSNLPFELSSDEVKDHFAQAGEIKQVRLVTNRSGKSKGYAYVEYETEGIAAAAILKFDKQMLKGRPINVSLSNPPARKPHQAGKANQPDATAQQFKPKTQDVPGSRGKSKTQIALVPRAVQKVTASTTSTTVASEGQLSESASDTSDSVTPAMSNADFRKFLLK